MRRRALPSPPALPDPMTLPALQKYVRTVVELRNFTRERDKILILLVEEVGELATELRHRHQAPHKFDPANLSYEIIDIFLYLLDLANGFGLDLISIWAEREQEAAPPRGGGEEAGGRKGRARETAGEAAGASAGTVRGDFTLNRLARHARVRQGPAPETAEELLPLLLWEAVGNVARQVRKSWKGLEDLNTVASEMIEVLRCLFELGGRLPMDFEAALAAKEKENAARRWSF